MSQSNTQAVQRNEMPIVGIDMQLRNVRVNRAEDDSSAGDEPAVEFDLVYSTGAPVRRYDWARERYYMESLEVSEQAIVSDRLQRGAPLLNSHMAWSLEDQVGVVDAPAVSDGQATAHARMSRRDSVKGYARDVSDGVIRHVSVGYVRNSVEMVSPGAEGGMWQYIVRSWTPMEVSLVSMPADMDASIRSVGGEIKDEAGRVVRTAPCEFFERASSALDPATAAPAETRSDEDQGASMTAVNQQPNGGGQAAPANPAASHDAVAAERLRSAEITELCARHGLADQAATFINEGKSMDDVRKSVLDAVALRDAAAGGHQTARVQTVRDEADVRAAGIEQAMLHRMDGRTKLDDNARRFRGMTLLEIGRDMLERAGVRTEGMDRMQLAQRMLHQRAHTSGDFSVLTANVANRRLRSAYDENPGTYTIWARRAPNAPDFKSISVAQLSGAPDLLPVNEHGEIKYGTMRDGGESYAVTTFGRIVSLTRQAIVNDDLRAFDRLVTAYGFAARRLENATVYGQLTANANMADGGALFNATAYTVGGSGHANLLSGAGSVLQESSLITGRTQMRVQKGLNGEALNIAPSYLLVPAALEQTAYKLTSNQFVPATSAAINEFRAGGRSALEPVVEPLLDAASATAWYMASDSAQVDTVEYCYLDGADGPVIESEMGFEIEGLSMKCRLDFAAKAVDFRGLLKSNGA